MPLCQPVAIARGKYQCGVCGYKQVGPFVRECLPSSEADRRGGCCGGGRPKITDKGKVNALDADR